jgi:HEAT repeat protein
MTDHPSSLTGSEPLLGGDKQQEANPVTSDNEPALGHDAMMSHFERVLKYPSPAFCQQAIMAALRMGQITTPYLIELIEDRTIDLQSRRLAVWAVALNTDLRALPTLSDALRSPDERIRRYAMEGLARLGNPAVPVLIEALQEDGDPAELAVEALRRIGPIAVSALINALDDPDAHVRGRAADTLGRIGEIQALPGLIRALGDENIRVRENAIEALGRLKQPAAVEPLTGYLYDPAENLRVAATEALRQIGTREAIRALTWRRFYPPWI